MSIALMVKVDGLVKRIETLEKALAAKVEQDAGAVGTDVKAEFEKLRDELGTRVAALEEHAKAVGSKLKIEF